MEPLNESLFDAQALESPAALASSLAPAAEPGHFDELRGRATAQPAARLPTAAAGAVLYDAATPPQAAEPPAPAEAEPAADEPSLTPAWASFF